MISITLAVVFLLIGLAYRSVVAPLRSVLTIGLTLGFVYGLAVCVYQWGAFDGLHLRALGQVCSLSLPPSLPPSLGLCTALLSVFISGEPLMGCTYVLSARYVFLPSSLPRSLP